MPSPTRWSSPRTNPLPQRLNPGAAAWRPSPKAHSTLSYDWGRDHPVKPALVGSSGHATGPTDPDSAQDGGGAAMRRMDAGPARETTQLVLARCNFAGDEPASSDRIQPPDPGQTAAELTGGGLTRSWRRADAP